MAKGNNNIHSSALTIVAFILSCVAFILVVLDSREFINKKDEIHYPSKAEKDTITESGNGLYKDNQVEQVEQNDKSKMENNITLVEQNIDKIIIDLEARDVKAKQHLYNSKSGKPNNVVIQISEFDNLDDANLELNRLRKKYPSIVSLFDSSVNSIGDGRYIITGQVSSIQKGLSICRQFEKYDVKCKIAQ